MNYKRITLICGHYGSGKTNIAVNMAFDLKKSSDKLAIADLDIVNPYFRTKDSAAELEQNGIDLICSEYAGTNIDIPALPQEMYSITDERDKQFILDIGGDDRGALVLGRLAPAIIEENNYEMLMVINRFRPLTRDTESTTQVMREIEYAGGIRFTGIINNSNLGGETTVEDILSSLEYAKSVSASSGISIKATTVQKKLYNALEGKIPNLFPLMLQPKIC